jgi:hypothetical protein
MSGAHNKGKGRGLAWLRENVGYSMDRCLRWPLSCDSHGYAQVGMDGKIKKAYRVMCEMAHGPAPTPKHEAAHTCGNGHMGCINPVHLAWKTRSENQRDKRQHGTHGKPGCEGRAKLTIEQVTEIRAVPEPAHLANLAKKYGCTPSTIAKIRNGERWASARGHLSPMPDGLAAKIRALRGRQPVRVTAEQFGLGHASVYRIMRGATPKSVYLKSKGFPSR